MAVVLVEASSGSIYLVITAHNLAHVDARSVAQEFMEEIVTCREVLQAATRPVDRHTIYRRLCEGQMAIHDRFQVRYALLSEMYVLVISDEIRGSMDVTLIEATQIIHAECGTTQVNATNLDKVYAQLALALGSTVRQRFHTGTGTLAAASPISQGRSWKWGVLAGDGDSGGGVRVLHTGDVSANCTTEAEESLREFAGQHAASSGQLEGLMQHGIYTQNIDDLDEDDEASDNSTDATPMSRTSRAGSISEGAPLQRASEDIPRGMQGGVLDIPLDTGPLDTGPPTVVTSSYSGSETEDATERDAETTVDFTQSTSAPVPYQVAPPSNMPLQTGAGMDSGPEPPKHALDQAPMPYAQPVLQPYQEPLPYEQDLNSGWSTSREAPSGVPRASIYLGASRRFQMGVKEVIQATFRGANADMHKYMISGEIGIMLDPTDGPLTEDFMARVALTHKEKIAELKLNAGVELIEAGEVFQCEIPAGSPLAPYYPLCRYRLAITQQWNPQVLSMKAHWQSSGMHHTLTITYATHPKLSSRLDALRFEIDLHNAENGVDDSDPICAWDWGTQKACWYIPSDAAPKRGSKQTLQLRYSSMMGPSPAPVMVHFSCSSRNVSGVDVLYRAPNGQVEPMPIPTTKQFKTGVYQVFP